MTQVVIVGAGPAGLTAAVALARAGIEVLVVERRREPSRQPRSTVASTRSMEIFRAWGLEDRIRAGAVDVEWRMWSCETLAGAAAGSGHQVGYPSREQSEVLSPTGPVCVPQDHLEPVLLAHLRTLPAAEVRLGVPVLDVASDADAVRVTLPDGVVTADYAIAADGAHSAVRAAVGIAMHGPDNLEARANAVFRAPLWELLGDRRYVLYATRPGTFLPAGDRWMFGVGGDPAPDHTPAGFTAAIRAGAGVPDLPVDIERINTYTFAAQLAERFRAGRVFLAGDAAHRVTPRGGTGMNTAVADGYDIGWKLAWTLHGWAGPDLLDTYEAERRPVAAHNVARSADPTGSLRGVVAEVAVDLGGRIPHQWLAPGTSTVDVLGPGLTAFTAGRAAVGRGPAPTEIRALDPMSARAMGVRDGGVLLVRPDGVPVGASG